MNKLTLNIIFILLFNPIYSIAFSDSAIVKINDSNQDKMIHIGIDEVELNLDSTLIITQKELDEIKNNYGKLDTNYTKKLAELAVVNTKQKKYHTAVELFKEVLILNSSIYEEVNDIIIRDLDNIGVAFFNLNLFDSTENYWKQSLSIREKLFDKNHPQMAIGINNIAYIYRFKGKLKEAVELYKEVIRIRKINVKGDHFTLSAPLNSLAIVLSDLGYFDQAEKYYKEAIEIERRLNNYSDGRLASFLNNLGISYKKQQRFLEAELVLKESIELKKKYMSSNLFQISLSFSELANLYLLLGSYNLAEEMFLNALELRKKDNLSDNSFTSKTLDNLAELYLEIEDFSNAEKFFKESLFMRKRLFNDIHPTIAKTLFNLGMLYRKQRDYKIAEKYIVDAINMYNNLNNDKQQDYALCLRELAILKYNDSNYLESEKLLNESLSILRKVFVNDNYEIAETLFELGNLNKISGKYQNAEKNYNIALNIMKNVFETQSIYLSEAEKEKYWNKIQVNFHKFADFTINISQTQQSMELLFSNLIYSKKIILNSNIKIKNAIFNSGNQKLIADYERWIFVIEKIATLYIDYKNNKSLIDSLGEEANELEKIISLESSELNSKLVNNITPISKIKELINKGEYLIEIFKSNKYSNQNSYYALILSKVTISLVKIGDETSLENDYYNHYIKSINQKTYDNLSYKNFWGKMEEKIENATKVYISPEGVYNKINIGSLLNTKTQKYLAEEIDIKILSNSRDIINQKTLSKSSGEIVLIGNPKFNLDDKINEISKVNNRNENKKIIDFGKIKLDKELISTIERCELSELKYAEEEINYIKKIINIKSPNTKVSIFIRENAREEIVKSLVSPRILHIATHGKYINKALTLNSNRYEAINPLFNSVLFFTGAESTIKNSLLSSQELNIEDGILSAYEARNLNLQGTELTVISSCESALGEIKPGEGLYSMQRAFLEAGSKSVITTLWKINDQTAMEFMSIFYEKYFENNSIEEAFKIAQNDIISKYDLPYYWAAFILITK